MLASISKGNLTAAAGTKQCFAVLREGAILLFVVFPCPSGGELFSAAGSDGGAMAPLDTEGVERHK